MDDGGISWILRVKVISLHTHTVGGQFMSNLFDLLKPIFLSVLSADYSHSAIGKYMKCIRNI